MTVLWTDRYGILTAAVGKGTLVMSVAGESGEGYRVTVANRRLKEFFQDTEPAKAAAIKFARTLAVAVLEETETP